MKKHYLWGLTIALIFTACSSGKKALQKGNYFDAVSKAVQRLQSDPDNKKASNVLRQSYPFALEWAQEELDNVLTMNKPFKWGSAVGLMERVNSVSEEIRKAPAARKIIPDPKVYLAELTNAKERAAEEQYMAGKEQLDFGTREAAKEAYQYFRRANEFVSGYRDAADLEMKAKELATLKVIVEPIPVHAKRYELTSQFFYDQIFEYLNNKYPRQSFVHFYSPNDAKVVGMDHPDMVVQLEFYDFVVGQMNHSEKEEEVKNRVKIETRDTSRVTYKTYVAKLKTFEDKVNSGGSLDVRITEGWDGKLLLSDRVSGSYTWVNDYAIFVGDKEALSKEQLGLTKNKAMPLPAGQDLFIEFTKPIYDQLTGKLNRFFRKYN